MISKFDTNSNDYKNNDMIMEEYDRLKRNASNTLRTLQTFMSKKLNLINNKESKRGKSPLTWSRFARIPSKKEECEAYIDHVKNIVHEEMNYERMTQLLYDYIDAKTEFEDKSETLYQEYINGDIDMDDLCKRYTSSLYEEECEFTCNINDIERRFIEEHCELKLIKVDK